MKILPVGAELFHVEGRTEEPMIRRDGVNICSSKFRERAQKNGPNIILICLDVSPCLLVNFSDSPA